nr:hydrolase [Brucella pseudogrignonensis]
MPKNELQPRQDKLIDQYREIGPAVLVAALMNKNARTNETRRPSNSNSILAVKKAD